MKIASGKIQKFSMDRKILMKNNDNIISDLIDIRADKYVAAYPSSIRKVIGLKDHMGYFPDLDLSDQDILGLDFINWKKNR